MGAAAIGWVSSAVLVATIGQQVWKQWRDKNAEGVSPWLFLGQTAASLGFTIYSFLNRDWVFVTTNAVMVANALAGVVILRLNRRRGGSGATDLHGIAERPGACSSKDARTHGGT